mgnify:CR=1 FL=1
MKNGSKYNATIDVPAGTTEVFVRDVSRDPGKATWYLRVLTAAKALQVPAAFAVLVAAVYLIGYPAHLAEAILLAGTGLVFFAGNPINHTVATSTTTTMTLRGSYDNSADILSLQYTFGW